MNYITGEMGNEYNRGNVIETERVRGMGEWDENYNRTL